MLQFPRKLLFGDEKLAFLSSPTGIPRLWRERHIPVPPEDNAHVYWASFTTVFDTPSDVFSLLSVSDIRRALDIAPENIASLVRLVAAHLESLIDDPAFCPQPPKTGGRGLLTGWIPNIGADPSAPKDRRDRVREALNCVRILTRLLPVIMEGSSPATSSTTATPISQPPDNSDHDPKHCSAFEFDLLWKRASQNTASVAQSALEKPPLANSDSDNQFVIDDGDDDDEETPSSAAISDPLNQPAKPETTASLSAVNAPSATNEPPEPCFMEQLLEVCINLLFRSGFTIPWTDDNDDASSASEVPSFVHLVIWYTGVGSSQELEGTTRAHESHRVEVLRLLLVVLSKSMYIPVAEQRAVPNRVASYAVSRLDRTVVLPLLCSLLNAVSTHTREAGWLGGISNNRLLGGGGSEDVKAALTALSLQTLNVLVGYEHARGAIPPTPGTPGTTAAGGAGPGRPGLSPFASTQSVPTLPADGAPAAPNGAHWPSQKNSFRFYLSKLHRAQDFQSLWTSLSAILTAPMSASAAFLPLVGPQALVGGGLSHAAAAGVYVPEALMLLWRMTLHNSKFRAFLLDDEEGGKRSLSLLGVLLFHALAGKDQIERHGLVRLCAFMLQDLSAEKAFGLHISKPGSGSHVRLPSRFGIVGTGQGNGSGADVLIQAVYGLIATTKGALASLYPPLVISLTNTAPYWRNMTVASATRLSQLLRSFSAPAYLLADEGNPRNLFYLLETFTFVLQYHFANNANFAYALVRSGPVVDKLATFTLRRGIADIRKRRARAGLVIQSPAPPTSPANANANANANSGVGSTPAAAAAAAVTTTSRVASAGEADLTRGGGGGGGILSPPLGSQSAAADANDGSRAEEKDPIAQAAASMASAGAGAGAGAGTDNEKARLAQREAELEAAARQSLSLPSSGDAPSAPPAPPAAPTPASGVTAEQQAGPGAGAGLGAARVLSDKARGKLRQSSVSLSLSLDPAQADSAVAGSGEGGGGPAHGVAGAGGGGGRRVMSGATESSAAGADAEEVDELVFSLNEEELYEAARTVGRHGFVPTQEWVTSWQKGLPLDTIQLALTELKPKVEALCASETVLNKTDADERVLAFLREQTLAGVLPPAPPIVTRPFRWTDQSQVWLTSYLFGCIYAYAVLPHAIWRDTEVKLFQVLEPPASGGAGR